MRTVRCELQPGVAPGVHRVVSADELAGVWTPELRFLVVANTPEEKAQAERLVGSEVKNVAWAASADLMAGDVVTIDTARSKVVVLYRESDRHHSLFATNRCNSLCLMCSQPPTPQADPWLIEEAMVTLCHMRTSPAHLGITGGEPTLLGGDLVRLLRTVRALHPATCIEVLTNGRRLADPALASMLFEPPVENVSWLVPLYGHASYLHDFVVQAPGAFDQTIGGLLALQEHGQPIQLRIVLIEPVLQHLKDLADFIARNLPFVREVALMASEPIGFALANRELCEVDLLDWTEVLTGAVAIFRRYGLPVLFMNTPLCALPTGLRGFAHQSISDWKNVFAAECENCAAKQQCSGLFAWHERGWKPTRIQPIQELV
ncbi:His-Xaa-Ser system radical SAM maturase HxsC [Pelomonas sp. Root1217]|uniref:His-Xaa-Ser system radical SAM maturase HxsC n=1 Tax=Pelomonas sp. Root1217 TaxID=1736430 RepID=UPI00070ECEBB|nr:His-Xaa-Ser system radical SAM maturase HxsC [Pelomonas sp. Root1217]KQV53289.1 His-Xaa-Ser system radical SAM maturase HxsC [Pelomonas sp. Root1217]